MDYIKVLEQLIAMDTSVPPGRNYDRAVDFLEPLFQEVGFETEKIVIPLEAAAGREGRVNLIAHRRQPGKPRLIFYSHIDVVPAEGWDAYTPRREGGKIYGRGAADMKGGIAGLLAGLAACAGKPLKYDVSVAVTTDEEYSQDSQLRYIKQYLEPVEGSYFFNLDAGAGAVGIASLGALHIEIQVKGVSVHSALSHRGVNAVENAILLMQALLALKQKVEQRKSAVDADPDTGLYKMEARLNIVMIQGGIKNNIVPDRCAISVDRRLIPEENLEVARQEIIDVLSSVPDVDWELANGFDIPTVPPTRNRIVNELAETIWEVTGSTGKRGEMGSGDLPNVVVNEWGGIPFSLGVIRPENNIHGKDEFVYIKDVEDLGRIIERFLT